MDSQAERRDFLGRVKDILELLLLDTQLMREGYRYFYVVDFTAIYGYIHRTSQLPFLSLSNESDERKYAQQQMALQNLFTKHLRPLLLIPPYATELNNDIRNVSMDADLARRALATYETRLRRLISRSPAFEEFVLLNSKANAGKIDDKLRDAAVKVGKEYFPELYTVGAWISGQRIDLLKSLFQNNALQDSDEVLPECRNAAFAQEATDRWYNEICLLRHDAKRAYQSWTDAMACSYIEQANRQLNPQKKIVVFAAPSQNVERTLEKKELIRLHSGRTLPTVRDLTYCSMASIHRTQGGNDEKQIVDNLEAVKRLFTIYSSAIPPNWREDAKEIAREWERCENLLTMRDPCPYQSHLQAAPGQEGDFLAVLEQLHRAVTNDQHFMAQRVEEALLKLQEETIALGKRIQANRVGDALSSMEVTKLPSGIGVRVVFPGLQDELPIALIFVDRTVVHLAQKLRRTNAKSDLETNVQELRSFVLQKAREAQPSDYYLLAGYILAVEGNYEGSLSQLEAGCENASQDGLAELTFLSAVIYRKLHHVAKATELLERALEIKRDDPRLNIEYGKCLWMRWHFGDRAGTRDLDRALEHLTRASRGTPELLDSKLRAQICNTAAFIYTERSLHGSPHRAADLETAEQHIKEMTRLVREAKWIGRFFDTRGYWRYAKAKSLSNAQSQERTALLGAAMQDIDKAAAVGESIGPRIGVLKEHRALVEAELNSFASTRFASTRA